MIFTSINSPILQRQVTAQAICYMYFFILINKTKYLKQSIPCQLMYCFQMVSEQLRFL